MKKKKKISLQFQSAPENVQKKDKKKREKIYIFPRLFRKGAKKNFRLLKNR